MTLKAENSAPPEYRPFQRGTLGKKKRIKNEEEPIRHQWFAVEPRVGTLNSAQCEALEKIFFGGKKMRAGLFDLSLSFLFSDTEGSRQILLRVSGTPVLRYIFQLDAHTTCRLVAVSSRNSSDERDANIHFFAT